MSAKQDRQGVRTAAQLEQKWKFGESFAEAYGIATDARQIAQEAEEKAKNPAQNLTQDQIFEILTDKGESQGMFREENGEVYINASFIKSGTIKGIIIESEDGNIKIDLSKGNPVFNTPISTKGIDVRTDAFGEDAPLMKVGIESTNVYSGPCIRLYGADKNPVVDVMETNSQDGGIVTVRDELDVMGIELTSQPSVAGITFLQNSAEAPFGKPFGHFRMYPDGNTVLRSEIVNCRQIHDGLQAKKVRWEYDENWGWILVGKDLNDEDFIDPNA